LSLDKEALQSVDPKKAAGARSLEGGLSSKCGGVLLSASGGRALMTMAVSELIATTWRSDDRYGTQLVELARCPSRRFGVSAAAWFCWAVSGEHVEYKRCNRRVGEAGV